MSAVRVNSPSCITTQFQLPGLGWCSVTCHRDPLAVRAAIALKCEELLHPGKHIINGMARCMSDLPHDVSTDGGLSVCTLQRLIDDLTL